jgi:hypothetical protein
MPGVTRDHIDRFLAELTTAHGLASAHGLTSGRAGHAEAAEVPVANRSGGGRALGV